MTTITVKLEFDHRESLNYKVVASNTVLVAPYSSATKLCSDFIFSMYQSFQISLRYSIFFPRKFSEVFLFSLLLDSFISLHYLNKKFKK